MRAEENHMQIFSRFPGSNGKYIDVIFAACAEREYFSYARLPTWGEIPNALQPSHRVTCLPCTFASVHCFYRQPVNTSATRALTTSHNIHCLPLHTAPSTAHCYYSINHWRRWWWRGLFCSVKLVFIRVYAVIRWSTAGMTLQMNMNSTDEIGSDWVGLWVK